MARTKVLGSGTAVGGRAAVPTGKFRKPSFVGSIQKTVEKTGQPTGISSSLVTNAARKTPSMFGDFTNQIDYLPRCASPHCASGT